MVLASDALANFLKRYPRMALRPSRSPSAILEGWFDFTASPPNGVEVTDSYEVRIIVPEGQELLPQVFETGGRVPRNLDEHVYPQSGALCLGSPLRLRMKVGRRLDLLTFANECIVPYLYAVSRKPLEGRFVFDELKHGSAGLLQDYEDIFGVRGQGPVLETLHILSTRPRQADRHPCPCGCGRRLGQCDFRDRLAGIRDVAPRAWFESQFQSMRKSPGELKT